MKKGIDVRVMDRANKVLDETLEVPWTAIYYKSQVEAIASDYIRRMCLNDDGPLNITRIIADELKKKEEEGPFLVLVGDSFRVMVITILARAIFFRLWRQRE